MKITIRPDGEVAIETNGATPGEVASMILCMQREMREQAAKAERPTPLNDLQGETYDYIVEHDHEHGVHLQAIAAHFKISKSAAGQRCSSLKGMGMVTCVGQGRYRAVQA